MWKTTLVNCTLLQLSFGNLYQPVLKQQVKGRQITSGGTATGDQRSCLKEMNSYGEREREIKTDNGIL